MGRRIAIEFKAPGDRFDRWEVEKLVAKCTLYRIREHEGGTDLAIGDVDLLLIGPGFDDLEKDPALMERLEEFEPGFFRARFASHPDHRFFLLDTNRIPIRIETIPFVMVGDDPERILSLGELLVEEKLRYPLSIFYILHISTLEEVIHMKGMLLKDIEVTPRKIVEDFGGKEKNPEFVEALGGKEKIPEFIEALGGLPAVLRMLGRPDLAEQIQSPRGEDPGQRP